MKLPSPTVGSIVRRVRRLPDPEADIATIDDRLPADLALARLVQQRPRWERFWQRQSAKPPIRIWIHTHTPHELRP